MSAFVTPDFISLCKDILNSCETKNGCCQVDAELLNKMQCMVYGHDTLAASQESERPDRLKAGDIWEFETDVKIKGKIKPQKMQWQVMLFHQGELAWQLKSLDGKYLTYLLEFSPQYEEMKFIGTSKLS